VSSVRADASRNRARIISAARDLVARDGAAMTMEELAERSGVAVGTLYRHFPTKAVLVKAILRESAETIAIMAEEAVDEVAGGAPAGPALESLVREVGDRYASDLGIKEAGTLLGVPLDVATAVEDPESQVARAGVAIATLLAAAQASGEVRSDVSFADLIMFLVVMPGSEHPPEARHRYIDIVLAGIANTAPRSAVKTVKPRLRLTR
jgi:AcrR family transcriptional regulator